MDLDLEGNALVTGSTAGIGQAIATTLAREGARHRQRPVAVSGGRCGGAAET
jgi:NAD(P)-dependent dehydrogenase (short-subunit alcohol dehydrogenase family)